MELHGLFCDAVESLNGERRTGEEATVRNSRTIRELSCINRLNYKPNSTHLSLKKLSTNCSSFYNFWDLTRLKYTWTLFWVLKSCISTPEDDPYHRNIHRIAKRLIKCVVLAAASMSILITHHNEIHFLHKQNYSNVVFTCSMLSSV
jgi:hypothetical protein